MATFAVGSKQHHLPTRDEEKKEDKINARYYEMRTTLNREGGF